MESKAKYAELIILGDKLERGSDAFQNLTKYHIEAYTNRPEYHDYYRKTMEEALTDMDKFFGKEK